jgi:hypothetical protein
MNETIDIPATQSCSIETLEKLLKFTDHMSLWDLFSHSINRTCKAEAKVDENGYVWIRVYAEATHAYGDIENPPKVVHGAGFIVHLSDMWTMAAEHETPYRHCDLCKNRTKGKLPSPFDNSPA